MRPVACLGLLATLSLCGMPLPVAAHPHSWIDMVSQLQIDERQQLTELHLTWLFDEFYSATILDEAQSKGHSLEQELAAFGQDTLNNLATENYLNRTWEFLTAEDVISGLWKAAVFGFIVTLMGCYHGYHSDRGAQGVGAATTNAVVSASIFILIFNFLLTQVFFS